jgi:hypothetical protein
VSDELMLRGDELHLQVLKPAQRSVFHGHQHRRYSVIATHTSVCLAIAFLAQEEAAHIHRSRNHNLKKS